MPVELRKRAAPPPPPPPAKKKATTKSKAAKNEPAAKAEPTPNVKATKMSNPSVGDSVTLDGFGGEVETNDEHKVTLSKLVEDSKAGVVLFTYPKASTPGCTTQVCLFRDSYEPLTNAGLSIYGLSNDSPKANTNFKTKQNLQYPLLCDPKQTLISAIGLKKAGGGTTRGVFVVDKSGKVLAAEAGGPAATLDVVKAVVETLGGSGGEKTAENKRVAEVADEVASAAAAAKLDRSKTSTPVV